VKAAFARLYEVEFMPLLFVVLAIALAYTFPALFALADKLLRD